ncbi:TNFAIP3-interacting protein 3-like [Apteryx rowi]|uniref:TNFAIP3-interacting protein 3-like n=1 Tax=Apteryx rowi TaxID=308060 RepID=UPI000E1DADD3|nr:TNFAIP3-interacting protein 3-like [Apteryx rowi]
MPPPDLCFQRPPPPDTLSLPRADSEEIVTYISEGMTVTSADEEKLQLLNKNTELRRLNKELMKLNQEWDQIYHSTTLGLQQKVRVLQQEMLTLRQQTERLTMKLDHEQSKREYYEQTLIQELKKNQHLQEYVRQLEGGRHHGQDRRPAGRRGRLAGAGPDKEVTDLKDQLEALKCQTEIYEADYRTEQRDRERIEAENEKLRKKEEEMRQQMLLLQEQLKIFEDDFRKERSDKQLLQRLLKSKSSPREPVLVHRCNSHEKPGPAAASTPSGASGPRRAGCSRHCEKPSRKQGECAGHSEAQLPAFGRDY